VFEALIKCKKRRLICEMSDESGESESVSVNCVIKNDGTFLEGLNSDE